MSKDKTAPAAELDTKAPAAAPAAPKVPDKNHGRGGMYTMAGGVRQRVDATKAIHEAKKG